MVIINDNVITISDTNGEKSFIIPESFKSIGAQFDENSIRINFKLPKIVGDNINLAKMIIKIKYINAGGKKGQYIVEDVNEENEYITFSWVLSGLVTRDSGVVKFNVCAVSTNDNGDVIAEWNTAISEFGILKGIDIHSPSITPAEKDIISQTISICQNSADEAAQSAQQAQAAAEQAAQGAQKSEAAATEADVSAQEAETSAVNSAASAQQAQTAAEQAAQEAQQSETSATESAASAQQAQEETKKVLDIIPVGGTKGQVLTKKSDTDKDYDWQDITGGEGKSLDLLVDITLEESISVLEITTEKYPNLSGCKMLIIGIRCEEGNDGNWVDVNLIGKKTINFPFITSGKFYLASMVLNVIHDIWGFNASQTSNNVISVHPNSCTFNIDPKFLLLDRYRYEPYDKIQFVLNKREFPIGTIIKIWGGGGQNNEKI